MPCLWVSLLPVCLLCCGGCVVWWGEARREGGMG
jgi:hypothetical protein